MQHDHSDIAMRNGMARIGEHLGEIRNFVFPTSEGANCVQASHCTLRNLNHTQRNSKFPFSFTKFRSVTS
jgi:hypothetical protein